MSKRKPLTIPERAAKMLAYYRKVRLSHRRPPAAPIGRKAVQTATEGAPR